MELTSYIATQEYAGFEYGGEGHHEHDDRDDLAHGAGDIDQCTRFGAEQCHGEHEPQNQRRADCRGHIVAVGERAGHEDVERGHDEHAIGHQ